MFKRGEQAGITEGERTLKKQATEKEMIASLTATDPMP